MSHIGKLGFAAVAALALTTLPIVHVYAGEVVWWTPDYSQDRALALIKKFEAANPGITVKPEIVVADGLPAKIQTALQSGSPPDVIEAQYAWVQPYAQQNFLQPLDDTLQDKADYIPSALGNNTWDGKLWGIPYRIDAQAIIYNRGMFKAAGLDPDKPPQTWPELIDAATKLTGKNSAGNAQYGYGITGGGEFGNTIYRSLPFIWMNGGDLISEDQTKATINEPAAVEAVTFYADFLTKLKASPPSTLQNDAAKTRKLFSAETVAMYQGGFFDIAAIHKENPNIDVGVGIIPHPVGKQTTNILGGWSFIVPKDAKNSAEAKKLIQFLSEPDNQGYFTDDFPARNASMNLPRFQAPQLAAFKQMLVDSRPVPANKNWIQITQAYFDNLQHIMTGDATPQDAMDEAADEINGLLQ